MLTDAPPTRRKFFHAWDEIDYLYNKILYWAYEVQSWRRAGDFSSRLKALLSLHDPNCRAILGASARTLIAEVEGDFSTAIKYRKREMGLIAKLRKIGGPGTQDFGPEDISDRMDLLAGLHWDAGNLRKAQELLEESREYCEKNHVPFDGGEMLEELIEKRSMQNLNGKSRVHAKAGK